MMRLSEKLTLIIIMMVSSIVSLGQTLPVVNIDTDPKAVSLGFVDIVSDNVESSVFANPAMMSFFDFKAAISLSYGYWQPNTFKEHRPAISGSYRITDRWSVAIGLANGVGMSYDMYDDSGQFLGAYNPKNINLKTGASYKILPYLSIGLNVGFVDSVLSSQYNNMGVLTDAFITSSLSDFKIAVGARNLGIAWDNAGTIINELPFTISAGASYSRLFKDNHNVGIYTQYDITDTDAMSTSIGASYSYRRLLSLRAGGRLGAGKIPSLISAGIGLAINPVEINLAYVFPINYMSLSNTATLSIVYMIR